MWNEINFNLSKPAEQQLFGSAGRSERGFRKLLAALDTQYRIGLPPAFFGYTSEGIPDPKGNTTIGMGYTHHGLKIVATGSTACKMLADRSGAIHAALMMAAQTIIPMHQRSGEHSAWFQPFERPFYVKSLGVGNGNRENFWTIAAKRVNEGSSWLSEAERKIPNVMGRSLMRQAVLLINDGDELEGNVSELLAKSTIGGRHWNETGTEFGQRLAIKLRSVGGYTFMPAGGSRGGLVLKDVEFTMCGAFEGPWFLGRLKIEARGQLTPATGAWTRMSVAA